MMMNMNMKKYIISGLVLVGFVAAGFAQEATEESQIELPDLTTVVSGSNQQEELAPAPDFDDVLELQYNSGVIVPVLPSSSAGGEGDVVNASNDEMQKDIYAEGTIGGGYPASFTGDFEVSRLYGADPFKISFAHESAAGYAGHNLADSYSNHSTLISVEKDFIRSKLRWGFAGRYEDLGNGFQSKVEGLAANNQDSVGLSANFLWALPKNFQFSFAAGSEFYYRFADITKSSAEGFEVPKWIKNTSRVTADPELKISWLYKGFEVSFDALYNLEAWSKVSNRGEFDLTFAWNNEKIKLFADAGVVVGNNIGNNNVVAPFTLGLETNLPVYFSDRELNLSLSGGLASDRWTTAQLEREYKFSGMENLTSETSDWFGKATLLVPLKTSFTGTVTAGFNRTAFGNGIWVPDFGNAESLVSGLYTYSQKSRNELFTDFAFTWKYKLFAATAKYHANWFENPVLENKHTISVNFALQSQKGLWGATLDTAYILDSSDKPVISMEGYVQASSAVRICLSVNDMLKLLGAEERPYAGQYVANSGNASLFVKFLF